MSRSGMISLRLDPDLLDEVDRRAGARGRSRWLKAAAATQLGYQADPFTEFAALAPRLVAALGECDLDQRAAIQPDLKALADAFNQATKRLGST